MKSFSHFFRLMRIYYIILRFNLDEIFFSTPWFYPFRVIQYFNPWHWIFKNKMPRGVRIRLALEALGPICIKAGQILSTRLDLIPEDIAEELAKLQDKVTPFCSKLAIDLIEKSLKMPITAVFREFDIKPLASASIAQVHAAVLLDNKAVVIKVLRPNIRKIMDSDLSLLRRLADLAERHWIGGRSLKPKEIIDEIANTLHDELDLVREASNASQLRRNFKNSLDLYVPEIYWTYTKQDILVMERIYGIPIYNLTELKSAAINLKLLAERNIEIFFTQVFRDSFFHADMHPGNIFVSRVNPNKPQTILVDFGIMGSLNTTDQRYLAENMLAFFKRDYQKVAELHIASGWLPQNTRVDQFEGAIRAVCEPMFERPFKEVSFGQLLLRLFQVAHRFNINIQPQLILLQKTLLNIESISRQIYPDVDLWAIAAPFLEKWVKQQVGIKAFFRRIKENLPYWSEKLPDIPNKIYTLLSETEKNTSYPTVPVIEPKKTKGVRGMNAFLSGIGITFLGEAVYLSLSSNPIPSATIITIIGSTLLIISLVLSYLI